jgi:eukaryotic-like serine/threonine-protein kinase
MELAVIVGETIGPYEVLAKVGEGGMGEVYRARDTKLNRDVAIKLLPADLVFDSDRLARFKREAQVLAALNHSNIGAIYGLEESGGAPALILEFIEGPTLADRIAEGPVPFDEAVTIARQITDALDAAHQQGIVHRDLKPANIKLRADGAVKVLDFGLAKTVDSTRLGMSNLALAPTVTSPAMTQLGVILGTASYMSPEQARGKAADRHSDIWAFGCVLIEMLTGEPVFKGETITDVLAAIVTTQPDLRRVPTRARRLLGACLERDPKRRLHAAGDAWLLLDDDVATRRERPSRMVLAAAAAALAAVVATAFVMRGRQPVSDRRPLLFHVTLPPGAHLNEGAGGGNMISPDGRAIVFAGMSGGIRRLWIRALESLAVRELPGTTGADFPFWSADGRSIGFFADGKLKRIDLSGGPPVALADSAVPRGGAWGPDGTILFASSVGAMRRVPAGGGTAAPLTTLDAANGENAHRWPQLLPGGKQFIYWVRSSKPNRTGIYISSIDRADEKTLLVPNANAGAYAPSHDGSGGFLLWARDDHVVAQPLDPRHAQLSGEARPIAGTEGIGVSSVIQRASFSVSNEGTILFSSVEDRYQLGLFRRSGEVANLIGSPDRYAAVRLSPEGKRAALSIYDASAYRDIWTMDLGRALPIRLTNDGGFVPVWSPDGRQIAFHDASQTKFFTMAADGSERKLVLESQGQIYLNDWSPDSQSLLYTNISPETVSDLWRLPLTGDRKSVPLLATPASESHGQYSPDGRWIAFTSDDSGQLEVYVGNAAARERMRVSSRGGGFARWRADGKELFYRSLDGRLMAVSVSFDGGAPQFGTPMALMEIVEPLGTFAYPYDVSPDGERILTMKPASPERNAAPLTALINWYAALKN